MRLDLKLSQWFVAKKVGISAGALSDWENGLANPKVKFMPKVIAFLGYNPSPTLMNTLGDKMRSFRIVRGLNKQQLAELLLTDASTIGDWEAGKKKPSSKSINKLEALIGR